MKKVIIIFLCIIFSKVQVLASAACKEQQPAFLKGITHGPGPDGNFDYIIVVIAILITLLTLYYSIKWLIKPGENNINHIKQSILKYDISLK
jgi:hypothetical protein